MTIRKFNEFKYFGIPGTGEACSIKINIDDDEKDLLAIEPELVELYRNDKIFIDGNELWYFEDDYNTIDTLKSYFSIE